VKANFVYGWLSFPPSSAPSPTNEQTPFLIDLLMGSFVGDSRICTGAAEASCAASATFYWPVGNL